MEGVPDGEGISTGDASDGGVARDRIAGHAPLCSRACKRGYLGRAGGQHVRSDRADGGSQERQRQQAAVRGSRGAGGGGGRRGFARGGRRRREALVVTRKLM